MVPVVQKLDAVGLEQVDRVIRLTEARTEPGTDFAAVGFLQAREGAANHICLIVRLLQ